MSGHELVTTSNLRKNLNCFKFFLLLEWNFYEIPINKTKPNLILWYLHQISLSHFLNPGGFN